MSLWKRLRSHQDCENPSPQKQVRLFPTLVLARKEASECKLASAYMPLHLAQSDLAMP